MLDVTIWGSRGSIPSSGDRFKRHGGATTCLEFTFDGASGATPPRVIIDCGTGLSELGKCWGERPLEALMLQTHMHWDHVQGFPFFSPLFNPAARFELWSVRREGMSLEQVLSGQMSGPMFPVGIEIIPAGLDFRDIDPIGSV
ncbi:MAG: MBL fold metallo-hydrolase, partial [Myxococcota bacterium]